MEDYSSYSSWGHIPPPPSSVRLVNGKWQSVPGPADRERKQQREKDKRRKKRIRPLDLEAYHFDASPGIICDWILPVPKARYDPQYDSCYAAEVLYSMLEDEGAKVARFIAKGKEAFRKEPLRVEVVLFVPYDPTGLPDIDNVARKVLNTLFRSDSNVTTVTAAKREGDFSLWVRVLPDNIGRLDV